MLSIRFDSKREWWVSGRAFARLFQTALRDGVMPANLEDWFHAAEANGGLDVSEIDQSEAGALVAALYSTAEREVEQLRNADQATEDGSYRISLQKLLALQKPSA